MANELSKADEIIKLKELHDSGILSQEEFERLKSGVVDDTVSVAIQPAHETALSDKSYNRTAAALLALCLGGVGAHKLYLGKPGQFILYLLFFWTLIPFIIGFVECIKYAFMSDEEFDRLYNWSVE
jgi:TM2 domain-containing membrane protein YozV